MCEPYHSVNQFESPNDGGDMPGGSLGMTLGPIAKIGKKIASWFHLSKAGAGHSEALAKAIGQVMSLESLATKYEVAWWNRSVHIDGRYRGELNDFDALEACQRYASLTSIGDLMTLRRFLESTLTLTDRGYTYIESFRKILSPEGVKTFDTKLKLCGVKYTVRSWGKLHLPSSVINLMVGMTRKRKLLVPEWADDTKLWLPS